MWREHKSNACVRECIGSAQTYRDEKMFLLETYEVA